MIRDDGVVKLMDFGIAQIVDKERMTVTGQLLGSPAYMAPEHVEGRPLDFRTDVFAVGILLYQLATGQLPFEGKNPHEVLQADRRVQVQPTRAGQPRWSATARRASSCARWRASPSDRYPDVGEMRRELAKYLDDAGRRRRRAPSCARYFADPGRRTSGAQAAAGRGADRGGARQLRGAANGARRSSCGAACWRSSRRTPRCVALVDGVAARAAAARWRAAPSVGVLAGGATVVAGRGARRRERARHAPRRRATPRSQRRRRSRAPCCRRDAAPPARASRPPRRRRRRPRPRRSRGQRRAPRHRRRRAAGVRAHGAVATRTFELAPTPRTCDVFLDGKRRRLRRRATRARRSRAAAHHRVSSPPYCFPNDVESARSTAPAGCVIARAALEAGAPARSRPMPENAGISASTAASCAGPAAASRRSRHVRRRQEASIEVKISVDAGDASRASASSVRAATAPAEHVVTLRRAPELMSSRLAALVVRRCSPSRRAARRRCRATPSDALDQGAPPSTRGDYGRAIDTTQPLLYPSIELGTEDEVVEAHTLLGVAYLFVNKPNEARARGRARCSRCGRLPARPDCRSAGGGALLRGRPPRRTSDARARARARGDERASREEERQRAEARARPSASYVDRVVETARRLDRTSAVRRRPGAERRSGARAVVLRRRGELGGASLGAFVDRLRRCTASPPTGAASATAARTSVCPRCSRSQVDARHRRCTRRSARPSGRDGGLGSSTRSRSSRAIDAVADSQPRRAPKNAGAADDCAASIALPILSPDGVVAARRSKGASRMPSLRAHAARQGPEGLSPVQEDHVDRPRRRERHRRCPIRSCADEPRAHPLRRADFNITSIDKRRRSPRQRQEAQQAQADARRPHEDRHHRAEFSLYDEPVTDDEGGARRIADLDAYTQALRVLRAADGQLRSRRAARRADGRRRSRSRTPTRASSSCSRARARRQGRAQPEAARTSPTRSASSPTRSSRRS